MASKPIFHIIDNQDEIKREVIDLILSIAKASINDHGLFTLGVSGGSVAKLLTQGLKSMTDVDWSRWTVLFCDERHVPYSDPESTYSVYKKDLFDCVNFPLDRVILMNPDLTVEEAAQDYSKKLLGICKGAGIPSFDLLVLGMGPDGHTCSLFPGHPGLAINDKIVIPITDSPKPPPRRITLTFPVLNAAKNVFVIATGESKAAAVKGSLEPAEGQTTLPTGMVQPSSGTLHWFLDTKAASQLKHKY